VPSGDWFVIPDPNRNGQAGMLGNRTGQNMPAINAGGTSLPYDALSEFLTSENDLRVQGKVPLAGQNPGSVKRAEHTSSLMIYMSKSLGVNCSYCHTTRAFARWEESTPQRSTAWYGIRMVRQLNNAYLRPLEPLFPPQRLGPLGDGPKVGCATCHKGTFKPLYGVSPLKDYAILEGVQSAPAAASAPPEARPVSL